MHTIFYVTTKEANKPTNVFQRHIIFLILQVIKRRPDYFV